MLSKRTKYALHALVNLARRGDNHPVHIADLAAGEEIPRKFLETILLDLKRVGLLDSQRGPAGGYTLARSASTITLSSVIRHLDGPLAPLPCASETGYRRCTECRDERTCAIRFVMREVRDEMARILDGTTLADLALRGGVVSPRAPGKAGRGDRRAVAARSRRAATRRPAARRRTVRGSARPVARTR